jgi:hypothetical protein
MLRCIRDGEVGFVFPRAEGVVYFPGSSIRTASAGVAWGWGTGGPEYQGDKGEEEYKGAFGSARTLFQSRVKVMDKAMGNEQMRTVMRDLRETEAILAGIEERRCGPVENAPSELQRKIEKNLAEITEKLKRLTG